jgi:hypothetical protein
VICTGAELKLVLLQSLAALERFSGVAFRHFFLQPIDGPQLLQNQLFWPRFVILICDGD